MELQQDRHPSYLPQQPHIYGPAGAPRLSHQPLKTCSLVGGGLDGASAVGPHPVLGVGQPLEQGRERQQRLFQVQQQQQQQPALGLQPLQLQQPLVSRVFGVFGGCVGRDRVGSVTCAQGSVPLAM
ncbi:mediator of RNA polymerase II transcription subunit 12-like protein [Corapipo altera]|uniref:mediator of RNA polymerase II transcription subunit 12-like protein n=1 Tax=Corapipo altera TaxID=415028 RepID=UPI000FD652F1|nr:mediator of RNA polymerase II transcription subunit 12-like protein [Corapipo altera]